MKPRVALLPSRRIVFLHSNASHCQTMREILAVTIRTTQTELYNKNKGSVRVVRTSLSTKVTLIREGRSGTFHTQAYFINKIFSLHDLIWGGGYIM
jgi:hypothetical protein